MRELDFKHLQGLVLTFTMDSHNLLIQALNENWAQSMGFTLKLKRPPKINKDGSMSVRAYCGRYGYVERANRPCRFAISFHYDAESKVWMVS